MPLPTVDLHPSGSILSGGDIRFAPLPANSRTPLLATVTTASAIAVDGVTATLTTTAPVLIDDDFDVPFGANKITTVGYAWVLPTLTAAAAVTAGASTVSLTATASVVLPEGAEIKFGSTILTVAAQTTVGTTATTVPIRPAPAAVATATASVNTVAIKKATAAIATATASTPFIPTLSLLGIESIDQPDKSNLISIRSQKSGLGNEQRPVMIDFGLQVSGWSHQRDQAYKRIVKPAGRAGTEVYAEYYSRSGDVRKGPAFIADLSKTEKNDDVVRYSLTVGFQGIPEESTF